MRMPVLCAIGALLTLPPMAPAQRWTWPEKGENLTVLPAETKLGPVMRGFTSALGVRCWYCHVGEEGKPLSSFDFVSDDNPNKDRAREMLRMLGDINGHLALIQPSGDQRVNMWCHTCHRGRPRPMTLEEELEEQYRAGGIEAALRHYQLLRTSFYGHGAYNFEDEGTFNALGYHLLESNDTEGAVRLFVLNTELFPQSANVWDSLGEGYMKAGERTKAMEAYRKSLDLDPRNEHAQSILRQLEQE